MATALAAPMQPSSSRLWLGRHETDVLAWDWPCPCPKSAEATKNAFKSPNVALDVNQKARCFAGRRSKAKRFASSLLLKPHGSST